jgi:hypothetical protein
MECDVCRERTKMEDLKRYVYDGCRYKVCSDKCKKKMIGYHGKGHRLYNADTMVEIREKKKN